jgi:membrane-associated protease RseP (regulator of RpoE activity)
MTEPFSSGSTNLPPDLADDDEGASDAHSSAEASLVEAQVSALLAGQMEIESVTRPVDTKTEGIVVFRGRLLQPSEVLFPFWLSALNSRGYTPELRPDPQGDREMVLLRIKQGVQRRAPGNPRVNIVLFALTVLSTLIVPSFFGLVPTSATSFWELFLPRNLLQALPFTLMLLSILGAHEFGHYFMAQRRGVAVSLPYFIPFPVFFGTLGAVIVMREPVPDRRRLFDIGVAGPLAGLALAVPIFLIGLSMAQVQAIPAQGESLFFGNSLFTQAAQFAIFGKFLPDVATGEDVILNNFLLAGWIGLLVTALNLLPVGQLDGGHVVFGIFGEKARWFNIATLAVMTFLGIAGIPMVQGWFPALESVGYTGWFIWLFLILFILGPFHPPALDDVTTLDAPRKVLGVVMIVIFILIFLPAPMRVL